MLGSTTGGWRIEADEQEEPADGAIVSGLSLDEKAALTSGVDLWHTAPIDRLGVPSLRLSDGPAGVRGPRFTGDTTLCIPCGSALAATWDRDLVLRVGQMLGDQARAKEAHVLLAPTVNLHRHPLTGRHFESFSEDPYLSARMAVAYISGVQSRGVACAVKHFVANDQEHERREISVEVDERTLREVYLQPFEAAVREAGVWSIMAAYNRLNGVHCTEHAGLLAGTLRRDWGFDGLVMSDWYATHSTAAVAAGLDLEMPGPARFLGHYLASAVHQGDLPEAAVDRAARHVLGLVERVTGAVASAEKAPQVVEDPVELARRAAREAIVLLRNDGTLPVDPARHGTVAVLGPKADRPDIQGGGSAHVHPPYQVTPLEGLVHRADRDGAVTVRHEPGVVQLPPAPLGRRELQVPGTEERGLLVEHFVGPDLDGPPVHREVVADTALFWIGPPVPGVSGDEVSVRASADFTPDRSGSWAFTVTSAGASRVLVDGRVVVDNLQPRSGGSSFFGRGSAPADGHVDLDAGTTYRLEIELHSRNSGVGDGAWVSGVTLHARPPEDPDAVERAIRTAAAADVAVVVVGTERPETEGADREHMDLPAEQNALVRAVAAVNPATVVVLNTGSPVTMDWVDEVGAIVQLWYPGQEGGAALAEVLFGDTDAAGRLPTTFPRRIEDTPAYPSYPGQYGRAPYSEGVLVGHRHYDAYDIEPLFCFGHGLSYTRFQYGELAVDVDPTASEAVASVDVTNVGDRWGQEVVQLYVRDVEASVTRPQRELQQFAKVALQPGETRSVRLELSSRAFAFWDAHRHDWVVEPGEFEIAIGSSSRRIHCTARLRL